MRRLEAEYTVRWLMVMRVAVTATLLMSAFGIELVLVPTASLLPLYILCAGSFFLVLTYALIYRFRWVSSGSISLQIGGDLIIVTGFVYATGGTESPMSFLYLVPIVTASVLLPRKGAIAAAAGASILYAALSLSSALRLLPSYPPGSGIVSVFDTRHALYSLPSHFIGFFLVALFSSYLAERLRKTHLELAERQSDLNELKALNENIVESINSGLITTGLDGRITFVNPGACEITRCRRNDLVGRMVTELFDLDSRFFQKTGAVLDRQKRFRLEKTFRTRSGDERFLGIAVSVLRDRSNRSLGYIFIFQDLTEINALERQVRLKERMAALGEMAAGMAHELRNPLASISGSVQVLKTELRPSGESLELMDIILRESDRLDQTIRDFLIFAKPGRFTPERTDLVGLLEQSAKLLRNSRDFRPDHDVRISASPRAIECAVDVNRLTQVFWNLASNALKGMPRGGLLDIRVACTPAGISVVFADEGVGMSEEEAERYFQPFRGSFPEGTGLGAAIVYRIVEEHGGTVALRSRPGQGTEVQIMLPAEAPSAASKTSRAPAVQPAGSRGAGGTGKA